MNKYEDKIVSITNPEDEMDVVDIPVYYVEITDPGVDRYSNGDPGYPPSYEIEMLSWGLYTDYPRWITDELVQEAFEKSLK